MADQSSKPHVIIVGAGFGGLRAARRLANAPIHLTIIDKNNYHLFQPLLYQVATAGLSPEAIAHPVRAILRRQKNLTFYLAKVQAIDLETRSVVTDKGNLAYDYLILAPGGTTHFWEMGRLARHALGLKSIGDAEQIRNHILRMCEEATLERDPAHQVSTLTFVIAGGGPTGVESAGALAELLKTIIPGDYPTLKHIPRKVILLEASQRLLPAMPDDLAAYALQALKKAGVEVRLGTAVRDYDGKTIFLSTGETITSPTLIWASGVRASPLTSSLPVEKDALGRLKVLPTLQIPRYPEVLIIGDAASFPDQDGKPLPMIAPVAIQQGESAAQNILRMISGREPEAFHYHDPGLLATIGRSQAVARIGSLKLRGGIAWLIWVVVHIYQLIGFRNRLQVMINWAWNYLLYDHPIRLIHHALTGVREPRRHPSLPNPQEHPGQTLSKPA
ncbi:MAG TPA: NAD(P)/FAD-dependent oxidoreductase [Anaerolinea thermolimosa]|uniref:NADH:ubiquinone reductase (non-electrogenic) n=1 Tax=Anaerolinea thermolimosa TaxID=229919 RepID=A0A3D1JK42_9CHLR|nr:NAD(P)/FAD-dependent oxidoreductase [Anaerolinea thermolimosa]GAP07417.1 NADH dehydrogenase, FAD-containing subunit [Anaerolinea thermolimosa]HCE18615.1 NAD(P)/FAD-dependent oxidoreductase [Anaerolinea thermolimosa]